uniref:Uncharacterized protein n=1 Tax=Arundo donax TaxID=35708 RepID=A0A0A8Z4T5_ARUDO
MINPITNKFDLYYVWTCFIQGSCQVKVVIHMRRCLCGLI